MWILDTNVLSEVLRAAPEPRVLAWLEACPRSQVNTTALTRAEILFGIECLPKGQRRTRLASAARALFDEDLAGHVLSFDAAAADHFAGIAAARRASGRPISQVDAMIAGIARSHGAVLVTQNLSDFEGCGLDLLDPWRG